MMLNGIVNDVRAAGSTPLSFWVEAAIKLTTQPVDDEVGLMFVDQLGDMPRGYLSHLVKGQQLFLQFLTPSSSADSILWSVVYPEASGRLLNMWAHTHPLRGFQGAWLISATPPQLGLESGVYAQRPGCFGTPFVPEEHGVTSEDVKQMIAHHAISAGLKLRCIWDGATSDATGNYELVGGVDGIDGVIPQAYDRQTSKQCFAGAERVVAGEPMTTISFFGPSSCVACTEKLIENHFHFQGYIVYDAPAPADVLQYFEQDRYSSYLLTSDAFKTCVLYATLAGSDRMCIWEIPGCGGDRYPDVPPAYLKTLRVILTVPFDFIWPGSSSYVEFAWIALALIVGARCTRCCCRSGGRREGREGRVLPLV